MNLVSMGKAATMNAIPILQAISTVFAVVKDLFQPAIPDLFPMN